MKNRWNDDEAAGFAGDVGQRVYSSRLLGLEPALVLHGGGNTSVKVRERDVLGEEEDILYVKGSGSDLAGIDACGFSPVRLAHLRALARLPALSDLTMMNELRTHCTRADAPTPSVEAILHAILPYRYVDHTHADAVVTLTNSPDGEARVREAYGDRVVVVPYVMPGFDLARLVAGRFPSEAHAGTLGMVLMNHGIFSFGDTARESYERMIHLVGLAEDYLASRGAWDLSLPVLHRTGSLRLALAGLRAELSAHASVPLVLCRHDDPAAAAFAGREDLPHIARQGPATPDHVIRTKRLPLLGRDVGAYVREYREYFDAHAPGARAPVCVLDPAPRVVLDPELGMLTAGRDAGEARVVGDLYRHTIDIILRAERLGGYRSLPAAALFDVEYWELEQAKLRRSGSPPAFRGEVALVTGAASGIGRACVQALRSRGAAVVGLDRSPAVLAVSGAADYLGVVADVTDPAAVADGLEAGVRRFGGLDMLVLNAGVFPGGCGVADLPDTEWHAVMQVNLDANLALLRESYPLLRLAPRRGRVVVMGSKNVLAPGPGAAVYSASKAALTQLARVTALEWAADGIRVNVLHPDAVFDTGIWTEEVLAARAARYGISVEQYRTKNLLRVEVRSRDVAELAAELCGPLFSRTTGAQIPVDGGNDRVI
jgi:rhamnose utilization protein RhaD (predicted bifunctional aldolase and dehydrogenase)/NAD(P)-dependent dehydrogenase (short-subunit alcohol dehydrogenase family)